MKILSAQQIREADQFTIVNEPIVSIDLMERASQAFVTKFLGLHPEKQPVFIFCGVGNNGGDGLAIGRLLLDRDWEVSIFVVGETEKGSTDFKTNFDRIENLEWIASRDDFPTITSNSIIVDGLFGSGLSRPIEGLLRDLVTFLNQQKAQRIAIDISSGLFSDQPLPKGSIAFKADYTISFQLPKLTFFLPQCEQYVGKWRVVDIGLKSEFIERQDTNFHLTEAEEMRALIQERSTFTHKNQIGRLMIVSGSRGMMGAAVLCTRGAFRAGAGLVNVHVPKCGENILQVSIPEAMVSIDSGENHIESIPKTKDVIALGPGIGTAKETVAALRRLLENQTDPMVVDADGINILSENTDMLELLPAESILTPHPGEFKRLVGSWVDDFEKLEKLKKFCTTHKLNVVLKGAFSAVCSSHGIIHFNPTGNPGLATAGSGDVLTGMVGSFLAQGLTSFNSLRLGVYLHGLAGDEAVRELQTPWIQASDIIDFIPKSVNSLLGT